MKKMTDKQKKILWACLALLVASYVFRSVSNYSRVMAYRRQAYQAWLESQKKTKQALAGNTVGSETAAALEHLSGVWLGRFAANNITLCDLRLELKEDEPGKYTGYSGFSCSGTGPVAMGDLKNGRIGLNPDTAILSGAMDKRTIRFHVDQAMGADAQGCAISSLIVNYFGTGGLDAQWQKGTCGGGHTLLARQRQ